MLSKHPDFRYNPLESISHSKNFEGHFHASLLKMKTIKKYMLSNDQQPHKYNRLAYNNHLHLLNSLHMLYLHTTKTVTSTLS